LPPSDEGGGTRQCDGGIDEEKLKTTAKILRLHLRMIQFGRAMLAPTHCLLPLLFQERWHDGEVKKPIQFAEGKQLSLAPSDEGAGTRSVTEGVKNYKM